MRFCRLPFAFPRRPRRALLLLLLLLPLLIASRHALTQAITGRRPGFDPVAASVGNARLLALAVVQYAQDYDERLPSTHSVPEFETAVAPYVHDPDVFTSPQTQGLFLPNAAVSGQTITALGDTGTVRLFQDAPPPGIPPVVGFLDGHVERGGVEQGDPNALIFARAAALALAVAQYVQDHDGVLPPTGDPAAFQAALLPYIRSHRDFYSLNGDAFVPNPAVSGVALSSLSDPSNIVLFQDTAPYTGGVPTVAYADGHVIHGTLDSRRHSDRANLNRLLIGVVSYLQDDDGVLPPTSDSAAFQAALRPYVPDPSAFVSPNSGLPYQLNPAVSGRPVLDFPALSTIELIRSPRLNNDGTVNIGYLDGHVAEQSYFLTRSILTASDGTTRLLWRTAAGQASVWTLGPTGETLSQTPDTLDGAVIGFSIGGDGRTRLLGDRGGGAITLHTLGTDGAVGINPYGPYDGWTPLLLATGVSESSLLWQRYDGPLALWQISPDGRYQSDARFAAPPGWTPIGLVTGAAASLSQTRGDARRPDERSFLLWKDANGAALLWTLISDGSVEQATRFDPHAGFVVTSLGIGPDRKPRLLWSGGPGRAEVWTLTPRAQYGIVTPVQTGNGFTAVSVSADQAGDLRVLSMSAEGVGRLQTVQPDGTLVSARDFPPYQ